MFNKKENAMGQLIRVCILGWSAALLTASYAGTLSKMDRIIYQKKTKITLTTREANIIFLEARGDL